MQRIAYWLKPEFTCPVKIATYKMFEELIKDSPFLFVVTFYAWMVDTIGVLLVWLALPEIEAQIIVNGLAIALGVVRFIPALISAAKAFRDRKNPEEGKH